MLEYVIHHPPYLFSRILSTYGIIPCELLERYNVVPVLVGEPRLQVERLQVRCVLVQVPSHPWQQADKGVRVVAQLVMYQLRWVRHPTGDIPPRLQSLLCRFVRHEAHTATDFRVPVNTVTENLTRQEVSVGLQEPSFAFNPVYSGCTGGEGVEVLGVGPPGARAVGLRMIIV